MDNQVGNASPYISRPIKFDLNRNSNWKSYIHNENPTLKNPSHNINSVSNNRTITLYTEIKQASKSIKQTGSYKAE